MYEEEEGCFLFNCIVNYVDINIIVRFIYVNVVFLLIVFFKSKGKNLVKYGVKIWLFIVVVNEGKMFLVYLINMVLNLVCWFEFLMLLLFFCWYVV